MDDDYKRMYVDFHTRRALEKGLNPQALWGSEKSQRIRFQILEKMLASRESFSVLDVGCGLGDFYAYLIDQGYRNVRYVGLEYNSRFVDEASRRYPDARFINSDMEQHAAQVTTSYDYIVASGIYNLGDSPVDTRNRIERDMRLAFQVARLAYGVNFLSTFADSRDPMSLYYQPEDMLRLGQSIFGRYARLYHDYLPHDFTLLLFKGAQPY